MRPVTIIFLVGYILLMPVLAIGQEKIYLPDTSVKVIAYGNTQALAWGGGFNTPQFSVGDLNRDGLQDLVAFEPWIGVMTYINKGTAGNPDYRYAPQYALNFPPIYEYLVLLDYNCDNISDLFQRGTAGFTVYSGFYNAHNQLCFALYRELYYFNDEDTHGAANAYCNPGDIPAIADLDNDGDLDFIAYNITGGFMNYYRNMRVEDGLPCDSIRIKLVDKCWGKVYQGFYRTHDLAQTCDNSSLNRNAERVTHSGNTPCMFDWDMDGDQDYLDGSVSFNEMTFLENGRIPLNPTGADTMISQDTLWQRSGKQINIPIWPAAFNVDVDQDGKKDLLVAPNGGNTSKNYNNIWYYKNYSTPGTPDWRFQSDSFLTNKSIDLGTASYPALFDYNMDGKPDLFIGSDGYSQPSGLLISRISYYLNTGTPGNPSFTLQTNNFMTLGSFNFAGAAPAMGDIDNDGKPDLVIGHKDGTLSYLKNAAASGTVQPIWQMTQLQLKDNGGNVIYTVGHAAPFIYDIDKDGKKDLLIGSEDGYLQYYRNVSTTPGTIQLQLVNTQLGHVKVDPLKNVGLYSTPFIGTIDSTGIDYLLLGSNSGNIYKYTGFQSGDTTATYTLVDSQFSYIDSTYNAYAHVSSSFFGLYDNLRTAPVVGDINGDGSYFMFLGNVKGGLELYRWGTHPAGVAAVNSERGSVLVYPNPVNDMLNISWSDVAQSDVQISLVNMAGQQLYNTTVAANKGHVALPVSMLPNGMYVCVMQSGGYRYYSKFTVVR